MSFKSLSKSLVDACAEVFSERNTSHENMKAYYMAEGLKKFGVKRETQLSEEDRIALHSWVQTVIAEACSCGDYSEHHMPGDDIFYANDGEMKKDLGEEDEEDIAISEILEGEESEKDSIEEKLADGCFPPGLCKVAGWIAVYQGRKLEIIKDKDAKDLYSAKVFAIQKLKVPKSKQGYLAIKPAYNESVQEEMTAQDAVKSELEKMGKSLDELTPEEKKELFNKVDDLVKAKGESVSEALDLTSGTEEEAIKRAIDDFLKSDAPQFKGKTKEEKIDMAVAAVKQARDTSKNEELKEEADSEADDISTNGAVAVGNAMLADPVNADIIKYSVPTDGTFEYRILLQYATGGDIFLGAPYEGTHIYPPLSLPGTKSLEDLKSLVEDMPFYNSVVERTIEKSMSETPHSEETEE